MTEREILIAARQRIERPEAWTQGVSATGKDGFPTVPPWSPEAIRW